jgi:hypothetical protein
MRRVGWGLLAAGALAMAAPALAGGPASGEGIARMQVELAWLADPLTFGCPLTAHVAGGVLEVRGFVPDIAVGQCALELARAGTTQTVVDHLQTNPNLVRNRGAATAEALREAARALLAEDFPERAGSFAIDARADGQITVRGAVGTLEEKLAVSRQLRWVSGCSCVANLLEVGAGAPVRPAAAQVPSSAPSAAGGEAPFVSGGTLILPPRTDPAAAATVPVAVLRRRIEGVCGRSARSVEVVAVSDREVEIRLRVASLEDGGRLSSQIVNLPELAKYRVDFQVRVGP